MPEKLPAAAIRNDLAPEPLTLREQLLAALTLRPYDTTEKLAADLGVSPYTIQILTSSDEFKLALTERFTTGQLRSRARATDAAVSALATLERLMQADDMVPYAIRLEAARVVLSHAEKITSPQAASAPALSVNIALSAEDLSRARNRALDRAHALTVEIEKASDVTPLGQPPVPLERTPL